MKYKVLLVEDNELNLKLFIDLLLLRNYEVIPLNSGDNLLNNAILKAPDLILMDIQLKRISGIDLIKQLKSNNKTKQIPIIAITALTLKDDVDSILESGCDKYISKPVGMLDFYIAIEELLPKNN